jgi:hypothetical protein
MAEITDIRNFKLISGEFSGDEARHVLISLVESKIGFHRIKNMSHKETQGTSDEFSEKRIVELEQIKAELNALIGQMADSGSRLSVNCDIRVQLIKENLQE